jgi:hypothetical protein
LGGQASLKLGLLPLENNFFRGFCNRKGNFMEIKISMEQPKKLEELISKLGRLVKAFEGTNLIASAEYDYETHVTSMVIREAQEDLPIKSNLTKAILEQI